jgi:hypothetical protein
VFMCNFFNIFVPFFFLFLFSCQRQGQNDSENGTDSASTSELANAKQTEGRLPQFAFTSLSANLNGHLIDKVRGPKINVCMSGVVSYSFDAQPFVPGSERWNSIVQIVQSSINKWIQPLIGLPGFNMRSGIVFHNLEEGNFCDLIVNVEPNPRAHAYFRPVTKIVLDPNSGIGTTLHEVGHAFGLGDTYSEVESFGGNFSYCSHPNPPSVMCKALSDLEQDDIAGIRALYASLAAKEDDSEVDPPEDTPVAQPTSEHEEESNKNTDTESDPITQTNGNEVSTKSPAPSVSSNNLKDFALALEKDDTGLLRVFIAARNLVSQEITACIASNEESCDNDMPARKMPPTIVRNGFTVYEVGTLKESGLDRYYVHVFTGEIRRRVYTLEPKKVLP